MTKIDFTFSYLEEQLNTLIKAGYKFANCEQYIELKKCASIPSKLVVLRVDVDLSVKKAEKLLNIFNSLAIKATFFLRLHAPEYNPFSFENYRIIKNMILTGHEIGYHSEIVDQAYIWSEDAKDCLIRDISIINQMFCININGVASHGGMTGLNNLDFWNSYKPKDFGLLYEGYDREEEYNIFADSFYISDSEWVRWKCYNKGIKVENDFRSPSEHIVDNHELIHLLIHPDTYYNNNFYDNER
jgi:hypothetical protein